MLWVLFITVVAVSNHIPGQHLVLPRYLGRGGGGGGTRGGGRGGSGLLPPAPGCCRALLDSRGFGGNLGVPRVLGGREGGSVAGAWRGEEPGQNNTVRSE